MAAMHTKNHKIVPKVRAEWHTLRCVWVHTPNDAQELEIASLHTASALFEKNMNPAHAKQEHEAMIRVFEAHGVYVLKLTDVLLKGAHAHDNDPLALEYLQTLAADMVSIEYTSSPSDPPWTHAQELAAREDVYKNIAARSPEELLRLIFNCPTISLSRTARNTGYKAEYRLHPLSNLYFMRDPMITTAAGLVIGRASTHQRSGEEKLIRAALTKLQIQPIDAVTSPGTLEGGDFFPGGDTAFIGCGMRTNEHAIQQLLTRHAFGCARVVVVHDSVHAQEQMHLDTYFNILDHQLAVLVERRLHACKGDPWFLAADVYEWGLDNSGYQCRHRGVSFVEYMRDTLQYTLIELPDADQENYGANFICLGPRNIVALRRHPFSEAYLSALRHEKVAITWVDAPNFVAGYGAARCSTQSLLRLS